MDEVVVQKEWPNYFPHVESTATLDAGYYENLEELQGSMGTYYVGSLLSFELMEPCARYARDLIMSKFPDQTTSK